MGENPRSETKEPDEEHEETEMPADGQPDALEFLPDKSPRFTQGFLLLGGLLGLGLGALFVRVAGVSGDLAQLLLFPGFLVGVVAWWLFNRLFPPKRTSILVGIDGVYVRSAFVPYSDVEEVLLEGREYEGNPHAADWGIDGSPAYLVNLILVRRARANRHVTMFEYPPSAVKTGIDEARQTPLVKAIEEGLAAWRARQDTANLTGEDLVARGESTPREWLTRLRALGSGATATYRAPAVSRDTLSRLATNLAARPSTRAAAALVLKASNDDPSHNPVRIGSTAFADTKLRVAVHELESASDDEAILEALQGIEAAESRVWAPPNNETPSTQRNRPPRRP